MALNRSHKRSKKITGALIRAEEFSYKSESFLNGLSCLHAAATSAEVNNCQFSTAHLRSNSVRECFNSLVLTKSA